VSLIGAKKWRRAAGRAIVNNAFCGHGIDVAHYYCLKCIWPPTPAETLVAMLADHLASLEGVGFGSDGDINGGDAVDAANLHFTDLRDALARWHAAQPRHGDPLPYG